MKVDKERPGGQQILTRIHSRICELFGAEQGAKIHSYVKLLIKSEISSQQLRSKLSEFFQNKAPGELDSFIDFMEIVTHEPEEKEELQKLERAFNDVTSHPPQQGLSQEEDKGISLKEVSAAEGKKVISLRGVGHSERRIAPLKAAAGFTSNAARKMLNTALTAAAATTKSPASDLQEPAYAYPDEDVMSLNSYRAEKGAIGAPFQVQRKAPISRQQVLSRLNLPGGKKRAPPPQPKSSSGSLSQFKYVRKSQSPPKKEKLITTRKRNEGSEIPVRKSPLEEMRHPEGGVISLNKRNNQIREKKEAEVAEEKKDMGGARGGRGRGRASFSSMNPYLLNPMMWMDPFLSGAPMGRARKDKTYIPPTSKYYRGRGGQRGA